MTVLSLCRSGGAKFIHSFYIQHIYPFCPRYTCSCPDEHLATLSWKLMSPNSSQTEETTSRQITVRFGWQLPSLLQQQRTAGQKWSRERGILTTYCPPETHDACGRRPPTRSKWVQPLLWSALCPTFRSTSHNIASQNKKRLSNRVWSELSFVPCGNFFLGGDGLKRILWQILEFLVVG